RQPILRVPSGCGGGTCPGPPGNLLRTSPGQLTPLGALASADGGEWREPGVCRDGAAGGGGGGDGVGGGPGEVAAYCAPAGERGEGMPVARDGLVPLSGLGALLGDVVRPVHGEVAGEQEDLLFVLAQPAAERVAGVVPGSTVRWLLLSRHARH